MVTFIPMIINDQQHTENTFIIKIKGLVQGVGFRPFIYRLAKSYNLMGWVENRNDGVVIKINCKTTILDQFITSIKQEAPPASNIVSIDCRSTDKEYFADFQIIKSETITGKITDISPDIAVCDDCLTDMKIQKNRIDYPFINCTKCGPRFTIISDLPYDRNKTTMRDFEMCPDCGKEYLDIEDRRFHAQPIACSVCGPQYSLFYDNKIINDTREIISELVKLIQNKKIIAIKGIGGFFLACNALSEESCFPTKNIEVQGRETLCSYVLRY